MIQTISLLVSHCDRGTREDPKFALAALCSLRQRKGRPTKLRGLGVCAQPRQVRGASAARPALLGRSPSPQRPGMPHVRTADDTLNDRCKEEKAASECRRLGRHRPRLMVRRAAPGRFLSASGQACVTAALNAEQGPPLRAPDLPRSGSRPAAVPGTTLPALSQTLRLCWFLPAVYLIHFFTHGLQSFINALIKGIFCHYHS